MKTILTLFLTLILHISFSQTYKAGDKVQIEWKGNWFNGKIESVNGEKYNISYDGYDASWNETVGKDRLKEGWQTKPVTTNTNTTSGSHLDKQPNNYHSEDYSAFRSIETIWDIVPSPDGKYVLATSAYGKLYILDANTLEEKSVTKLTEGNPLFSSAWSPDGKYIATFDPEKIAVIIYSVKDDLSLEVYANLIGYADAYKFRFSPKSNMLLISAAPEEDYTKTQIDIYYLGTERIKKNILKSTNADHSISDITWSNDGSKIAVAVSNKKKGILLYDSTGKLTKTITHTHDVTGVSFSPDGKLLASGGIDGKVTMWNLSNYSKVWSKNWKDGSVEYVRDLAFSPNGKSVAVCGGGSGVPIRLYDSSNGSIVKEFGTTNPVGNAIYYSSDSKNVFASFTTYGDISKASVVCRYSITEK